jgi:predicted nucleic acid-binding protein
MSSGLLSILIASQFPSPVEDRRNNRRLATFTCALFVLQIWWLSPFTPSIGIADSMIADIALEHGLELVTGNTAHFQRVQQLAYPLTLANWRI